jgi:transcriptional regulator with XRE-family HTH domain
MKFGEALRLARGTKTLGQLSRHLGVSVPYLSDVERSHRHPLSDDYIDSAAAYLKADHVVLHVAAALSRGYVKRYTDGMTEAEIRQFVEAGIKDRAP